MIESISVPSTIKTRLDQLMKPGESYGDVIARVLDSLEDDDYIDAETEEEIQIGIKEFEAGFFLTEEKMAKKLDLK